MAIEVTCRQCGKGYKVADEFAGRSATCKACGAPMRVPKPVAQDDGGAYDLSALADVEPSGGYNEPLPFAGPPLPPMPAPSVAVSRPARGAFPKPPARQPYAPRRRFRLNRISIGLLVGGCVLGFFGVQEMRLASAASATPHHLTCKELEEGGPGGNAHVTVDKFLVSGHYIYKKNKTGSEAWQTVWVPVVAVDGKYISDLKKLAATGQLDKDDLPPVRNVGVLIKSAEMHSEQDVDAMSARSSVTGMVVNLIERLNADEEAKLKDAYPQTDFSKCWIIEEGREPAPAGKYIGMLLGGAVLTLLGLATTFPKA